MPGLRKLLSTVASTALRPESLLGAGEQAPDFDLQAHDGGRVTSASLAGRSYVLVFYPRDNTPGCTLQLRDFERLAPRFAALDCPVFGVNHGDAASHCGFADKLPLGAVRLLVDPDRRLAEAYRTARPGVPLTFRAVFFVDGTGIVRAAMKDAPDPEAVLRLVERYQETGNKGTGRKGRQLVPEVSGYGVRKLQEADPRTAILDVREPADWRAGHIPGAVNIPMDTLVQRMTELPDRDTPLVIACDQGLRASGAARILHDSGWRKLYTLIDGMEAYKGEIETA